MTITRNHILAGLATLLAVSAAVLALAHHATIDFYFISVEWLFLAAIVGLGYGLWTRKSIPLCHITFVRSKEGSYLASTEYYRGTRNGGRALAEAIERAQADGSVISITYTEGRKQRFIPIHQAPRPQNAPVAPQHDCPDCHDNAWYYNGKRYACANCEALNEQITTSHD